MTVRAKFRCTISEPGEVDGTHKIALEAFYDPTSEENKSFFKYTPSGYLKMSVVNPDVAAQFEVGKAYYIDFAGAE